MAERPDNRSKGGRWARLWARLRAIGARPFPHGLLVAIVVLYILGFFLVGFVMFYSAAPQAQPVPKVTIVNGTDVKIIAAVPNTVTVLPLKIASQLNITVDVIPSGNLSITGIYVVLGSNQSRLSISGAFKEASLGATGSVWHGRVAIAHSGTVQTIRDVLTVLVVYHYSTKTSGQNSTAVVSVGLPITVVMSDFPSYFYLFILSLGVIFSRLLPVGTSPGTDKTFSSRDIIWIPFSVVISLLIFTAFRQQVTLTTDIVTNFALAFGFGFAFEKALASAPAPKATSAPQQKATDESAGLVKVHP